MKLFSLWVEELCCQTKFGLLEIIFTQLDYQSEGLAQVPPGIYFIKTRIWKVLQFLRISKEKKNLEFAIMRKPHLIKIKTNTEN